MRVISGIARGHKLISLEGDLTRPTTDRVKEAMFSIIQMNIAGSVVLDMFAGSGALGIEALSRGAVWCDFVENNKQASEVIQKNIEKTRLKDIFALHNSNAQSFAERCNKKYDVVFLDPPYNKGLCEEAMSLLKEYDLLNDGAIIVCEASVEEIINSTYPEKKQAKYGNTKLVIFENR